MLRQRVLTAIVLLPIVLGTILFAPLWLFDAVVGLALVLLALEYAALCRQSLARRIVFSGAIMALFGLAVVPWQAAETVADSLLIAALALWLAAPLWLLTRRQLPNGLKLVAGLPMIAGAGIALHGLKFIHADGRWVLLAFLLVWAADIGGYAAGRTFGRHKLAPSISPGKTWEGFGGGVLLVLLLGATAAPWLVARQHWFAWGLFLLAMAVLSVIGDLVESLLKRQADVKDSGNLLPGHGGLLDRLDSLLAVAPVFLLAGFEIGIFGELSLLGR